MTISSILSLFRRKPDRKWLDREVHAWLYSQWGRSKIVGTVARVQRPKLVISYNGGLSLASVWEHDTRLIGEPLPEEETPIS